MDFCMRLASEVIIKEINENPSKNFVMSPLSLNLLINMAASGARGRTLEQLLEFLESESIADINAKSSQMIGLATMDGEPNRKEEPMLPNEGVQFGKSPTTLESARDSSNDRYFQQQSNSDLAQTKRKPSFLIGTVPIMIPPAPMNKEYHMRKEKTSWMRSSEGRNEETSRQKRPELSFVGGIWMDRRFPIQPSFWQIAKDVYKAEAKTLDFEFQGEQVRKEVNMWAENETKGLIKDLIPSGVIKTETILILANALYFKGEWFSPFRISRTRHEAFYLLNGTTVRVPFMKSNNERYFYASLGGFKILKLPYAGSKDNKRFSMYLFLPHKNDGLQELMQNFNSQSMFLQKNLPLGEVELSKLWIPKLKFSYGFDASEMLKKLGLALPFELVGDFTEMVDSPLGELVYISNILHKSFIEVNEEGTEAAAAASCFSLHGCSARQYPPPPLPSFVADHPFMFMIKEEVSGTVFFTGTVLNPLKED